MSKPCALGYKPNDTHGKKAIEHVREADASHLTVRGSIAVATRHSDRFAYPGGNTFIVPRRVVLLKHVECSIFPFPRLGLEKMALDNAVYGQSP